jgi:hypothetical protein
MDTITTTPTPATQDLTRRILAGEFNNTYFIPSNLRILEGELNNRHVVNDYIGAQLPNANLYRKNLRLIRFIRANLQEANLQEAKLQDSYLTGANLTNANLKWADLREADLREANLTGANLTGANLSGAFLIGTLRPAIIDTTLRDVNLRGVDFTGTDLSGAVFYNANVTGVDFSNAINVEHAWGIGEFERDDDDDDDEDFDEHRPYHAGVAYEVHNYFETIRDKIEEYEEIIDTYVDVETSNQAYTNYNKNNFTEFIQEKMVSLIEQIPLDIFFTEEKKNELITRLDAILHKLNESNYLDKPKTRILIGKTLNYVATQPTEFYSTYLKNFVQDCYEAYDGVGDPNNNISCPKGIVERFVLSVGSASFSLCPSNCVEQKQQELDLGNLTQEQKEKEIKNFINYAKLKKIFGFTIKLTKEIIREYFNEWFEKNSDKNTPETTTLNNEERTAERKQLLTEFVKKKAIELLDEEELSAQNIDMINDEVEGMTYSLQGDKIQAGGKRQKKHRKTNKRRKTKKHRKTNKRRKTKKYRK